MKYIRITKATLEVARKTLTLRACGFSSPADDKNLILAKGITQDHFRRWVTRPDIQAWGIKVFFKDGLIIAEELVNSPPHADAVGKLIRLLGAQDPNFHLAISPEHRVDSQGKEVSSDILIKALGNFAGPGGAPQYGDGFPIAVVEVGVSQSLPSLHRKLNTIYCHIPSIEYYVAIKRYEMGGLLAMLFERAQTWNDPTSIISFGPEPLHHTARDYFIQQGWAHLCVGVGIGSPGFPHGGPPCNAPNIALYQIALQAQVVFLRRAGGIPVGAPLQYIIDLFQIQRELMQPV